jgi:hypothetical protein
MKLELNNLIIGLLILIVAVEGLAIVGLYHDRSVLVEGASAQVVGGQQLYKFQPGMELYYYGSKNGSHTTIGNGGSGLGFMYDGDLYQAYIESESDQGNISYVYTDSRGYVMLDAASGMYFLRGDKNGDYVFTDVGSGEEFMKVHRNTSFDYEISVMQNGTWIAK